MIPTLPSAIWTKKRQGRSDFEGEGKGQEQHWTSGGVSGLAGTFVGLGYTTNNFLGLGETLHRASATSETCNAIYVRLHRTLSVGSPDPGRIHRIQPEVQLRSGTHSAILTGSS